MIKSFINTYEYKYLHLHPIFEESFGGCLSFPVCLHICVIFVKLSPEITTRRMNTAYSSVIKDFPIT